MTFACFSTLAMFLLLILAPLIEAQKNFDSFDAFVNAMPSCAQPCVGQAYEAVLSDCQRSDTRCICLGGSQSEQSQYQDGTQGGQCIAMRCSQQDALIGAAEATDFAQFCTDFVRDHTSSNSATAVSRTSSSYSQPTPSNSSSGSNSTNSNSTSSNSSTSNTNSNPSTSNTNGDSNSNSQPAQTNSKSKSPLASMSTNIMSGNPIRTVVIGSALIVAFGLTGIL